jgi:hypothetical protein
MIIFFLAGKQLLNAGWGNFNAEDEPGNSNVIITYLRDRTIE